MAAAVGQRLPPCGADLMKVDAVFLQDGDSEEAALEGAPPGRGRSESGSPRIFLNFHFSLDRVETS